MNVLITGGAEYIGSNTFLIFIDKSHHVTIIDNLITGYEKLIPKKNSFYKIIKSDIPNVKNVSKF